MKKIIYILILIGSLSSCADFLDIVPENVASMDNAFSNRENSMKFLYTCYKYLPDACNPDNTPGFLTGDEYWMLPKSTDLSANFSLNGWNIARCQQNVSSPLLNYWDGGKGGHNLWVAIRDCNIFLENIHKPVDLDEYERIRWIAEVKCLKAYYHYYLLRLYGAIPIMDKNIEVNADIDEVRRFRDPVDDVVAYIVATIDECKKDLPLQIVDEGKELGRLTRPAALAIKAQTLLLAASPLFNGNPNNADIVDKRGIYLFSKEYKQEKWDAAAVAAKEAIECAEEAGHELYQYTDYANISDVTRRLLSISKSVSERWNEELIFGVTSPTNFIQKFSCPALSSLSSPTVTPLISVTMNVAESFYTKNGVPMDEDNSEYWVNNYHERYKPAVIPDEADNKYYLEIGEQTALLNMNREPRFYANLGFDRGAWYIEGNKDDLDGTVKLHAKKGEFAGRTHSSYNITGYFPKKIVGTQAYFSKSEWVSYRYTFPVVRLADLYLMYAEALNESLPAPNEDVYIYIDKVRLRAGLEGVVSSWMKYSSDPEKPKSKDGMRNIIRQERLNELSLEGQRFWDLRRWRINLDRSVKGWNVMGETVQDYYNVIEIYNRSEEYGMKDYLWPLSTDAILKNPNLVQNPGW